MYKNSFTGYFCAHLGPDRGVCHVLRDSFLRCWFRPLRDEDPFSQPWQMHHQTMIHFTLKQTAPAPFLPPPGTEGARFEQLDTGEWLLYWRR